MSFIALFTIYIFAAAISLSFVFALIAGLNDRSSATNRVFVALNVAVIVWLIAMYLSLGPRSHDPLFIKLTLFFATPMNALFFLFAHTLPEKRLRMRRPMGIALAVAAAAVMALSLSPWTFREGTTMPGAGLIVFGLLSLLLNAGAIYVLVRRMRAAGKGAKDEKDERAERQMQYVMIGIVLMFGCIIATIFVPFAFFGISSFVTFFPVYAVLFLGIAAYAIVKEDLLDAKVIVAEIAVIMLLVIVFARIFIDQALAPRALDSFVFAGVAVFGWILVMSVHREVAQREELQRLDKELEKKNVQLEEVSRFKSELLSLASHQIRSPLAAIKGFASLITTGVYGDVSERVKGAVSRISASAEDLINLINTLLDVRRVEEGRMEYQFAIVDIATTVRKAASLFSPLAQSKKLAFEVRLPEQPVLVRADEEKLRQIVQNLIDNAIKYTPSGFVHVVVAAEDGNAAVTVADSGLGIPAALIPHLFEESIRDERIKRQILGSGLGLYIARKITEAHGGTLLAKSSGEERGSTFVLSLPLASASGPMS